VTVSGITTTYSMVTPERTGICMLIKGEHDAADLHESWFALSSDEPDIQERERDTPGL
jgi:hypothetical protein